VLGGRQAGKAPGFGPGIRRFESFPPSQNQPLVGDDVGAMKENFAALTNTMPVMMNGSAGRAAGVTIDA
jgi:hypothetical protein